MPEWTYEEVRRKITHFRRTAEMHSTWFWSVELNSAADLLEHVLTHEIEKPKRVRPTLDLPSQPKEGSFF